MHLHVVIGDHRLRHFVGEPSSYYVYLGRGYSSGRGSCSHRIDLAFFSDCHFIMHTDTPEPVVERCLPGRQSGGGPQTLHGPACDAIPRAFAQHPTGAYSSLVLKTDSCFHSARLAYSRPDDSRISCPALNRPCFLECLIYRAHDLIGSWLARAKSLNLGSDPGYKTWYCLVYFDREQRVTVWRHDMLQI